MEGHYAELLKEIEEKTALMASSREEKETSKNNLKDQMSKTLEEQGDALSIETQKTMEAAQ